MQRAATGAVRHQHNPDGVRNWTDRKPRPRPCPVTLRVPRPADRAAGRSSFCIPDVVVWTSPCEPHPRRRTRGSSARRVGRSLAASAAISVTSKPNRRVSHLTGEPSPGATSFHMEAPSAVRSTTLIHLDLRAPVGGVTDVWCYRSTAVSCPRNSPRRFRSRARDQGSGWSTDPVSARLVPLTSRTVGAEREPGSAVRPFCGQHAPAVFPTARTGVVQRGGTGRCGLGRGDTGAPADDASGGAGVGSAGWSGAGTDRSG